MQFDLSNEDLLLKYRSEKLKDKKDYYAEKLYEQSKNLMYSKLNSYIKKGYKIDDIAEVEGRMLEAWYDAVRYCDPSKSKFSTYLVACVNSRIYKYIKNDQFTKKHVHATDLYKNSADYLNPLSSDCDLLSILLDEKTNDDPYEEIISKLFVEDSLEKLKTKNKLYYDVVQLAYVYGYSQQRISDELNISQPQVSRRLSRAITVLKNIVDEDNTEAWGKAI